MFGYFSIGFISFMLAGKTLTGFRNLFLPSKTMISNKTNNIHPNLSSSLSDNQQFKLNRVNEVKDYFVSEIKERELIIIKVCKMWG